MLHKELTSKIINSFYKVYNTLGFGFLEKVYENALVITLRKLGFDVAQQSPIKVYFEDALIGEYFADLIVADLVIVEIKAIEKLHPQHTNQLINYLKSTKLEVGLILNFGPEPEIVRKIFTNDRKKLAVQSS